MIIFCDTNIVMEYLQQRTFAPQIERVLTNATQKGDHLFISSGSFYTITYLTERYLKTDTSLTKEVRISQLRYILNGVLGTFKLADQFEGCFGAGVNDLHFNDLEDSYQAHIAEDMGCDVLLTINSRHFSRFADSSTIKIMTPQAFVETYLQD
jgi:predicted nucleic acid-binding protein